jgi:branched-chain amino acid aminotransferase
VSDSPLVPWIWKDGAFVPWQDANIHILSHVVHYGSSVFEGVRCYETPEGPAFFRLRDHLRRLEESARIYQMPLKHEAGELAEASRELFRRNEMTEGYLRPLVIRGFGALGLNPTASPVETYLMGWPWGQYLGAKALEEGVDACVSTWLRPAPNTFPALAKAGGNYLNSQLMKLEAARNGYAEGIALGPGGVLSEGGGENIFVVRKGEVLTPELDGTMLDGITRNTILALCGDLGIPAREARIPREALYTADEAFFTGTAAELTPIRSVDRIPIGDGVGPLTRRLQTAYMDLVRGRSPDPRGWREVIAQPASAGVA